MFRELELNWKGKPARLKPTMDLLRFLEQRGLGPHMIAAMRANGNVAVATYAEFVAAVLQFAGFAVKAEDVFVDAHQDVTGLRHLQQTVDSFIGAMLPDALPKVDAPTKKPARTRRATTAR